jgi:hypothetical protein
MKKAGDFLSSLLDANVIEKAAGYAKLFSSWPAVAQEVKMPSLSDHSWIRELEKSVLLVEADHPGWIQLLQTKQSELLTALRRRFPAEKLSGISFRLCKEGPRRTGAPTPPEEKQPLPPADTAPGVSPSAEPGPPATENAPTPKKKNGLDSIKDTRLREVLARLETALKGKNA